MVTLDVLRIWTPFMLGGLAWNILIAITAMIIGTIVGGLFSMLLLSETRAVNRVANFVISFFRNVPTLVLVFYLATLLPNQWVWFEGQFVIPLPSWFKASLALAGSPLGFAAWNVSASVLAWKNDERQIAMLFIPNWLSAFLITFMASSVASLVGVDELVGRCNTIINATSSVHMIPIYLYASAWFFVICFFITLGLDRLKLNMMRRYARA